VDGQLGSRHSACGMRKRCYPNTLRRISLSALSASVRSAYVARMPLPCTTYQPRDAERGVLYRIVEAHLDAFLNAAADPAEGSRLPMFVEQEFRDFLTCGVLARGFARLRCDDCEFERDLKDCETVSHSLWKRSPNPTASSPSSGNGVLPMVPRVDGSVSRAAWVPGSRCPTRLRGGGRLPRRDVTSTGPLSRLCSVAERRSTRGALRARRLAVAEAVACVPSVRELEYAYPLSLDAFPRGFHCHWTRPAGVCGPR
jgi:hypothetical protein